MALWKNHKRKTWHFEFQYRGKRYTGSGFKTKGEARAAREERRKHVRSEKVPTQTATAFSAVANQYLDWAKRRFAIKTYEYKVYVYRSFLDRQGDMPIDQIIPQILHDYLSTRHSNHNYNAHRKDLCALFTYARQQLKMSISHPCWDLEKMPHTPAKKEPPSEEEILRMVMSADPDEERPLILTLLHTLARVDEILRLTWQDVNFQRRFVRLWTRKRKDGSWEADELYMNDDLYKVLRGLWSKRKQDKWVFYNERTGERYMRRPKLMRSLCRRAGIKHFGFHALRHAMATLLEDQEKVGTATVSGILRHKSVRTTEIYLHKIPAAQIQALKLLEGKFGMSVAAVCDFESKAQNKTADHASGEPEIIEKTG